MLVLVAADRPTDRWQCSRRSSIHCRYRAHVGTVSQYTVQCCTHIYTHIHVYGKALYIITATTAVAEVIKVTTALRRSCIQHYIGTCTTLHADTGRPASIMTYIRAATQAHTHTHARSGRGRLPARARSPPRSCVHAADMYSWHASLTEQLIAPVVHSTIRLVLECIHIHTYYVYLYLMYTRFIYILLLLNDTHIPYCCMSQHLCMILFHVSIILL